MASAASVGRTLSLDELRGTPDYELARVVNAATLTTEIDGAEVPVYPELAGYRVENVVDLVRGRASDGTVSRRDFERVGSVLGHCVVMGCDSLNHDQGAALVHDVAKESLALRREIYGTDGLEAFEAAFDERRDASPEIWDEYLTARAVAYRDQFDEVDYLRPDALKDAYLEAVCRVPDDLPLDSFASPRVWLADMGRRVALLERYLPLVADDDFRRTFRDPDVGVVGDYMCGLVAAGAVSGASPLGSANLQFRQDRLFDQSGERAEILEDMRSQLNLLRGERAATMSGDAAPYVRVSFDGPSGRDEVPFYDENVARMFVAEAVRPETDLSAANPRWRGPVAACEAMQRVSREARGLEPEAAPAPVRDDAVRRVARAASELAAGSEGPSRDVELT